MKTYVRSAFSSHSRMLDSEKYVNGNSIKIREKCYDHYNRTTQVSFLGIQYEGIPENLILNIAAWLVRNDDSQYCNCVRMFCSIRITLQ
jgi:hypothetical protein